jgi:hypothetical protein
MLRYVIFYIKKLRAYRKIYILIQLSYKFFDCFYTFKFFEQMNGKYLLCTDCGNEFHRLNCETKDGKAVCRYCYSPEMWGERYHHNFSFSSWCYNEKEGVQCKNCKEARAPKDCYNGFCLPCSQWGFTRSE